MIINLKSPGVQLVLGTIGGALIGFVIGVVETRPVKNK